MRNSVTAAVSAIVLLSACSSGSGGASSTLYPAGVSTDAAALHNTKGVYTGDTLCCWLNGEAQFVVAASADAKQIVLQTYEPTSGPLSIAQSITIAATGSSEKASRPVHAGRDTILLPILPGMLVNGMVTVHLVMGKSIVPKDIGLNGDLRRLSVVVTGATAR